MVEEEKPGKAVDGQASGKTAFYEKPTFWFGLLNLALACGALIVAGMAYCQGGKALEWQKERERTNVELRAELDGTHFAIGEMGRQPSCYSDSAIGGISIFALLKVNNLGGTKVSIDDIWGWVRTNGSLGELTTKTSTDLDYVTESAFPIMVGPGEQARLLVKMPWLVDKELLQVLKSCVCQDICRTADAYSIYQSLYPIGYIHMGLPDRQMFVPFTQMFVQHNSVFDGRKVDMLVGVHLASGEGLEDTVYFWR